MGAVVFLVFALVVLATRGSQILAGGALLVALIHAAFAVGQWHEWRHEDPPTRRGLDG